MSTSESLPYFKDPTGLEHALLWLQILNTSEFLEPTRCLDLSGLAWGLWSAYSAFGRRGSSQRSRSGTSRFAVFQTSSRSTISYRWMSLSRMPAIKDQGDFRMAVAKVI